jgi:hypothetical protein
MNNPEFDVHILNEDGIRKAQKIAETFDQALTSLIFLGVGGRYLSIVRTKMEEAAFFAKKGMAIQKENQKEVL